MLATKASRKKTKRRHENDSYLRILPEKVSYFFEHILNISIIFLVSFEKGTSNTQMVTLSQFLFAALLIGTRQVRNLTSESRKIWQFNPRALICPFLALSRGLIRSLSDYKNLKNVLLNKNHEKNCGK